MHVRCLASCVNCRSKAPTCMLVHKVTRDPRPCAGGGSHAGSGLLSHAYRYTGGLDDLMHLPSWLLMSFRECHSACVTSKAGRIKWQSCAHYAVDAVIGSARPHGYGCVAAACVHMCVMQRPSYRPSMPYQSHGCCSSVAPHARAWPLPLPLRPPPPNCLQVRAPAGPAGLRGRSGGAGPGLAVPDCRAAETLVTPRADSSRGRSSMVPWVHH